jgi:hypothetical protein
VFELRTFSLGDGTAVVAVRGGLDASGAAIVAAEVGRHRGAVVVDLLRAHLRDLDALDDLVACCDATFVADRPLRDAFDVIGLRRHVLVEPSLAAALA